MADLKIFKVLLFIAVLTILETGFVSTTTTPSTPSTVTTTTMPMLIATMDTNDTGFDSTATTPSTVTTTTMPMLIATMDTIEGSNTTETTPICNDNSTCQNNGTCSDNGMCNCTRPYSGDYCQILDECPAMFCNSTTTLNCTVLKQTTPYCTCKPSFIGETCNLKDACYQMTCNNNGTCVMHSSEVYSCKCVVGNPEKDCLLNQKDDCADKPPKESIKRILTCIDKIGDFEYDCMPNYMGTGCGDDRNGTAYCINQTCENNTAYCNPLCDVEPCNTGTCHFTADVWSDLNDTDNCAAFFGSGFHTPNCLTEQNLFNGFDNIFAHLNDCSPFFETVCTQASSHACLPQCNTRECLWGGLECLKNSTPSTAPSTAPSMYAREGPDDGALFLNGTVVIQVYDYESLKSCNSLSLLLRSLVQCREHKRNMSISLRVVDPGYLATMNRSLLLMGNFTSVGSVSRYLAASFAKRNLNNMKVVDVYDCPSGTTGNKCTKNCSTNCLAQGDVCNWKNGTCLHGCQENDMWGDVCAEQCPFGCDGGCSQDEGVCSRCKEGKYGQHCDKDCDKNCVNNVCNRTDGSCTCQGQLLWDNGGCSCKGGFYGMDCAKCPTNCKGGTCFFDKGDCNDGCNDGFFNDRCNAPCGKGCKTCKKQTGQCHGDCKNGYSGQTCTDVPAKQKREGTGQDSTGIIIAVIVAIIVIIVIILAAFCYWRRSQSGDYKPEEEELAGMHHQQKSNQLELENAAMQPVSPMMGRSAGTDMIDLDTSGNAGVYTGRAKTTESSSTDRQHVSSVTVDIKKSEVRVSGNSTYDEEDDKKETNVVSNVPEISPPLEENSKPEASGFKLAPLAMPEAVSTDNVAEEDAPPPAPTSPVPPIDDDANMPAPFQDVPPPPVSDADEFRAADDTSDSGMKDTSSKRSSTSSSTSSSSSSSSKSSKSPSHEEKKDQPTSEI